MKTSGTKRSLISLCITLIVVCVAAFAQNPEHTPQPSVPNPVSEPTPKEQPPEDNITKLNSAAKNGNLVAKWQLASMYASGKGISKNEHLAFDLFQQIITKNSDISSRAPNAHLVSNAYVMLSKYYRSGVLSPRVAKNPEKARDLLTFAASYFADADAQYLLAKMYIEGEGGERNSLIALRWLKLASKKGHIFAQTTFGHLLFNGMDNTKPDRVQGLAWMTIAYQAQQERPELAKTHFNIIRNYEWASALATQEEHEAAMRFIKRIRKF